MEEFNAIVDEFETVVNKLAGWYNYFKEEDLLTPVSSNMNFGEALGKQISSLKADVLLLRCSATIISLNNAAKTLHGD